MSMIIKCFVLGKYEMYLTPAVIDFEVKTFKIIGFL